MRRSSPAAASDMRRTFVLIAWVASVAGAVWLGVGIVQSQSIAPSSYGVVLGFAGLATAAVVYASVGALLTLRRPANSVGLVLMGAAGLIVLTFSGFIFGVVLTAERGQGDVLAGLVSEFGGLGITPTLMMAGPVLALVFPDGRLPGPRWRSPIRMATAAVGVSTVLVAVRPGPIGVAFANNPLGITNVGWLNGLSDLAVSVLEIAVPVALLVALVAVFVRFRRSGGVERQQLKWFVGANFIAIALTFAALTDGATDATVFDVLAMFGLSLPAIAVGIAVLRYRLYEIDRIISRTLAYTALTAALALVYVAAFVVLQAVLAPFTQSGGPLAVAASTLAVFALFQPLRRRLQSAMDRRFNRSRYDAQRTVEAFAARLRDEVDLDRLGGAVQSVVGQALAPATVGIWLRPSERAVDR
jgi:hypothetical protein